MRKISLVFFLWHCTQVFNLHQKHCSRVLSPNRVIVVISKRDPRGAIRGGATISSKLSCMKLCTVSSILLSCSFNNFTSHLYRCVFHCPNLFHNKSVFEMSKHNTQEVQSVVLVLKECNSLIITLIKHVLSLVWLVVQCLGYKINL